MGTSKGLLPFQSAQHQANAAAQCPLPQPESSDGYTRHLQEQVVIIMKATRTGGPKFYSAGFSLDKCTLLFCGKGKNLSLLDIHSSTSLVCASLKRKMKYARKELRCERAMLDQCA